MTVCRSPRRRSARAPLSSSFYLSEPYFTVHHKGTKDTKRVCLCAAFVPFEYLLIKLLPAHEARDERYRRRIIREDHRQIFGPHRAVAGAPHHHFNGTAAGAVDERHFALRAIGP